VVGQPGAGGLIVPAYNFQARFAPAVMSGIKNTTIRGRAAKVGGVAYLFTGMRTKACERLGRGEIVSCLPVKPGWTDGNTPRVQLSGKRLNVALIDELAQREGFTSSREMVDWFEATYGPRNLTPDGGADVYAGFLIKWALEA
jgi:hypothetical protein